MNVRAFQCGPFANDSERKAFEHVRNRLDSIPGDGAWVLLTNLAFSVTHRMQADEIDLVVIGPPGVQVVEVKHWTPEWVDAHPDDVEHEADKVTHKARRIGTTLRRPVPELGRVDGAILLTRESSRMKSLAGRMVRGVGIHTLKEWRDAIGFDAAAPAALRPPRVEMLSRLLEPKSAIALDGSLRRFAGYVNLELRTPKTERFHRVYAGVHSARQDRVILHLYDLSAREDANAEKRAQREFEALRRLQLHDWAPRVLDSFQDAPGYAGEMHFFTVVDPAAPSIEKRKSDASWTTPARLAFARNAVRALQELHGTAAEDGPVAHRNLTARTILVRHDGQPILTGFEWSKIPSDVSVASSGAPAGGWDREAAPEVRAGGRHAAGQRSDVYSLCASLTDLFQGRDDEKSRQAVEVLGGGLAVDPGARRGLEDLETALAELLGETPMATPPPPAQFWTEEQVVPFKGGKYRVAGRLGSGGVGTAFRVVQLDRATQEDIGTYVAKVAHGEETGRRLVAAYSLARSHLRHQAVSSIFEVAEEWRENEFTALLTWIDGSPLSDFTGVFPLLAQDQHEESGEALAVRWLRTMCEALDVLHRNGLVHGDVSPRNMIVSGGDLVLTDYDFVRKIGEAGAAPGTVLYCALSSGTGPASPADDLYALAASFFHVLFEREPFRYDSDLAKQRGLNWEGIERADYPTVADFLDRAAHPDAKRRFGSVREALEALERSKPVAVIEASTDGRLPAPDADVGVASSDAGDPRTAFREGALETLEGRSDGGAAPDPDRPSAVSDAAASGLGRQRQRLVDWARRQLVGPAGAGWLAGSPVERYPTGVLHPIEPGGRSMTGLDPAQPEQDEAPAGPRSPDGFESAAALPDDEDDDAPAGADGGPGPAAAKPVGSRRYVPPSSVGVSFHVRGDARLRVTASAASYRRVRERGAAGRFATDRRTADPVADGSEPDAAAGAARYERTPFECGLVWPTGAGDAPPGLERQVSRRPYRDGEVLTVSFSDRRPTAVAGAPPAEAGEGKAQLDVRRRPYGDGHILTVVFANPRQSGPPGADRAGRSLFEARLECAVESGELAEYPRVDPALLTDEEREIELRYRDRRIYAIGHGAAADWSIEPDHAPRIWSEHMPAVDVPSVTTQAAGIDDVLVMHDVAEAPFEAMLDRFDAFVDGYDEWVRGQREEAGRFAAGERETAARVCDRMDAARDRMRGGVARLRRDPDAALAFRLANRAMLDQMRQHDLVRGRDKDVREYRWRPFQLAFLLTVIESTIDEGDSCRGVLDLIWFPTGGGKTEAYLGLFAFLVVWRRLRYGEEGGGTAAIMRYTLRLLTRQQFERAARIVCALELLRRRSAAPIGSEPITVGLWVGAAASPNTFEEAAKQVAGMAAAAEPPDGNGAGAALDAARPGAGAGGESGLGHHLVLTACPWCGRRLAAPHGFRAGPAAFEFLCGNRACAFGDGRPLPCNVVDEALYERPPTLLVGTVDKFARLAWEERAAAFFGGGARRPPELVLQDELHLIAGPLGSVAGLYEAAVETVIERRGVRPKYVASTATIRMAREQVRRLYGREMAVFPPPGLSADDSWFARTDRSGPGRLYVGYLAPGLDQQRCLAPLAAVLLAAPTAVFADQQDRDDLLDAWWTQVVYHGSLRGVGASHNAFVTDVRAFMRRLDAERRDAVRRGEGSESDVSASGEREEVGGGREAEESGFPASGGGPAGGRGQPVVVQLTSQSTAQENARTFDRLAEPRGAAACLDAVLATNMISVGVDVDRLAAMVVNGQPLTTAEYIQASSRIGRAGVPGLVFTNYYRQQARSLSHYENFRPYHESFHRFVEPTSVTPFTHQVRRRALHAALVIALRHGGGAWTANAAAGRFDKDGAGVRAVVDALKRRCRRADADAAEDLAVHLDRLVDEWHGEAARCRDEKRGLQYHCRDNAADSLLGDFGGARRGLWKTLNSMRNIEETAVLQAATERTARDAEPRPAPRPAERRPEGA